MVQEKNDRLMVTIRCLVYNHEKYIRQCLDGFVMQQTNFRFVAIVHDDASTDNSATIIKEYADRYPDIIKPILEKENLYSKCDGSLLKILNENTLGKYVAMCEGDDYWTDPLKLQKQIDFLENNKEYVACAHQSNLVYRDVVSNQLFCYDVPRVIQLKHVMEMRPFHTNTVVYRKEQVFDILYNDSRPDVFSGDRLMYLILAGVGEIYFFDDVMSIYRKHSMGASSTVTYEQIKRDLAMIPFLSKKIPNFPIKRLKSYLYKTIALYPRNIKTIDKIKYLLYSFIYSFSYFPYNLYYIISKLYNRYK